MPTMTSVCVTCSLGRPAPHALPPPLSTHSPRPNRINGMKWSELREDGMVDARTSAKARIFLMTALFIACGCIAGSGFLMADK